MEELVEQLTACEALLRSAGEEFWASKLSQVLKKNGDKIDLFVIEQILSWYGGMGSFSDLLISKYNGHNLSGRDEREINRELNNLRSAMFIEATKLSKLYK